MVNLKFMTTKRLYETDRSSRISDPQAEPISSRRLITQPYDIVVSSLIDQIDGRVVHLRPLSNRPSFQRNSVWTKSHASKLIESILLNVPIPPCYLAQDDEFELDVIDGQQRIYSIYRFMNNQYKLSNLEVLAHLNRKSFHQLPRQLQSQIRTYTLRCVIVTKDSDPEIRFEVFQRLNTQTMPLNAQELRHSICRGSLMDLLYELEKEPLWLEILNRTTPDNRMRGAELILRFFAFHTYGINGYRTPQKHWLDFAAREGRHYSEEKINKLAASWKYSLENCLIVFKPGECFRRLPLVKNRQVMNRALMDLTMYSLREVDSAVVKENKDVFYKRYVDLIKNDDFADLITRSVDHKSRTLRRFELWTEKVTAGLF